MGLVLPLTADQQVPPDALAGAMDQMADQYNQFSEAAHAVRSKYEIETCAKQYLQALEVLLGNAGAAKPRVSGGVEGARGLNYIPNDGTMARDFKLDCRLCDF